MPELQPYNPSMQSLVEAFFAACFAALGWDYHPSDVADIEEVYMRHGMFWCLFDDNALVGTIAIRSLDQQNEAAEMKRLYVLPEYQGKGYGEFLFQTALDWAKASGYQIIRLDTRQDRSASRHLIEKYQFRQIEPYNQNAFAELFYERNLIETGG